MSTIQNILVMMDSISYGFVDRYKVVHKKIKKDFYMKEYRLQSPEITLNYSIGTCWDQVELIRYLLEKEHIPVETYIFDYDEEGVLAKHTIAVASSDGGYYWMESSWENQGNSIFFNTIPAIIEKVRAMYPKIYKIPGYEDRKLKIFKYDKPEYGIDFEQFCNHCRNGTTVDKR